MLHKTNLEKHNKSFFNLLLIKGNLYQHCAEVERKANEMYELLIGQMKEAEGITEQLKEQDQWDWVQRMSNIQQRAREVVCCEFIYT